MVVKELTTMGNSASYLATLRQKFCLDTPRTESSLWRVTGNLLKFTREYGGILEYREFTREYGGILVYREFTREYGSILVYREFNESTEVS